MKIRYEQIETDREEIRAKAAITKEATGLLLPEGERQ
jgi:hypothetical protein